MSEAAPRKFAVERSDSRSLNEVAKRATTKCPLCKGQHTLQKCDTFRRLNPYKRLGAVRKHKYCVNCLAQSHFSKNCHSRERCMECRGKHHTMLHFHRRGDNKKGIVKRKANNKSTTRSQAHECSCQPRSNKNNNNVVTTPNSTGATIVINVLK